MHMPFNANGAASPTRKQPPIVSEIAIPRRKCRAEDISSEGRDKLVGETSGGLRGIAVLLVVLFHI